MVQEPNAEQIENFALVPVRRTVHREMPTRSPDSPRTRALSSAAAVFGDRLEMINDFESRLGRITIDPGHRTQSLETKLVFGQTQCSISSPVPLRRSIRQTQTSPPPQYRRKPLPADYPADHQESFAHQFRRGQFNRSQIHASRRASRGRCSSCAQSSTPFFQMKKKPARISTTKVSISKKAEHLELLVNHCPRIQKDRFNVEQDKQHRHQIELHAEACRASPVGAMPHS